MSDVRTIEQIWDTYGMDDTGSGRSEVERLRAFVAHLNMRDLDAASGCIDGLREISHSYGWAESDSFHSAYDGRRDDEALAAREMHEAIYDSDYSGCIDATERLLAEEMPWAARAVAREAIQAMRDGYEAGRKAQEATLEDVPEPDEDEPEMDDEQESVRTFDPRP